MLKKLYLFIALLFISGRLLAQAQVVKGVVKDSKGEALPGVNVIIQGKEQGSVTDFSGNYTLSGLAPTDTLVYSYIGYTSAKAAVNHQQTINMVLNENLEQLNEVVVVGYGAVKKDDMTGAVNTLKASDLPERPSANVGALLQGQAAGLQVTNNTGQPGSSVSIRLRGVTSTSGSNSPLVVVDGFPLGDAGGLNQINPSDIETFNVLKDASATAIYGSRGANGVIMITTKSGKKGKMTVNLSARTSLSTLPSGQNIVSNPEDYAIFSNEARRNAKLDELYTGQEYLGTYYPSVAEIHDGSWGHATNWADVVYRNALTHDYNISARGGNDHSKYYFSLGYLSQEGINIGDQFDKYNFRFKYDSKIYRNVTAGANVIVNFTEQKNNAMGGAGRSSVFPVYNDNGDYFFIGGKDYYHPLVFANEVTNKKSGKDIIANMYLEWTITKDLKFKTQMNMKYGGSIGDIYEPIGLTQKGADFNGYGRVDNYYDLDLLNESYFTYDKDFGDKHHLTAMVGQSYQTYNQRTSNLEGQGFVNDVLTNENLSTAKTYNVSNKAYTTKMLSYYGRLNYAYDSRYLLTATFRADGSSVLANKWNGFSSFAAGWNISKENFMKDISWLDNLKLRASWGQAGNQSVPAYSSMQRYGSARYYDGSNWQMGFGPGTYRYSSDYIYKIWNGLGNKDLEWETTATTNIGLDAAILDSRLMFSAEYYNKKTTGMLRSDKIPPNSGYDEITVNSGEMTNKGFELSLDAAVITPDASGFEWNVKGTLSKNINTVDKIGNNQFVWWGGNVDKFRTPITVMIPGQPLGAFYGYKTNGIIQSKEDGLASGLKGDMARPGEIKYLDADNNGQVTPEDRRVIGNPNPDFIYSINSTMKYKGFDFSVLMNGVQGNDVYNMTKFDGAAQYNRWTPDHTTNDYPSLNETRGYMASDWWIEDGSFLRIQNVTLGYTFNTENISWLSRCRVYTSVDNLAVFSKFQYGYDPEVGVDGINWGGYPKPRTFSVGLNITLN